jgi:cytochrome b involved in lipid metabolism
MKSKHPHKNKLKTTVAIGLSVSFAVMAAIIAYATVAKENPTDNAVTITENTQQKQDDLQESALPGQTQQQTEKALSCGVAGGTCTKQEVAMHNKPSDCWVIYEGSYYNVTSYVSKHPGGKSVFTDATCGKDIALFLSGEQSVAGQSNEHKKSAYTELEQYKVGSISQ